VSPLAQGGIALALLLVLIALRFPIGLALGLVSFGGLSLVLGFDAALSYVGRIPYEFAGSFEFSAIPMFILMGAIAYHSGMTASIYTAARLWMGRLPGGLAVATNFACAGFGAASGSTLATTVAMGKIGIPEMLRYKYHPGLATAACACGGTLAAVIPPSIALIVYGILTEVSIAKLFVAGILPGLLTAVAYGGMIILRCMANPSLAPRLDERPSWPEKLSALREVWPLPVLALIIIGGIYSGVMSPTEAGGAGALTAVVIAVTQRRLTFAGLRQSLREAMVTTAIILFVAIGALMLSRYMAVIGLPNFIASFATGMTADPLVIILFASLVFLLLGMFLDPLGIMLITIPIFLPLFRELNYDLIWFGIIVVKFIEIGLLTPPVGLNVFAVSTLVRGQIDLHVIFRGILWFLVAEAFVMTLLFSFPEIATWLPTLMD